MLEAIPHFLIALVYFLVIIPVTIVLVANNEISISNYFKNQWSVIVIILSGGCVFLLAKYISVAFSLLFLHVIGFFGVWYYWYFRRANKHLYKE